MNNNNVDITFLHTGEVHVQTFSNLIERYAKGLKVEHIVNADFLEDAMQNGITPTLTNRVSQVLQQAGRKSKLVVCSCSTLGVIAESCKLENGNFAIRIDRAMADHAVNVGKKILVLAALQSTINPTTELLKTSQKHQNRHNEIDYFVVENCWTHFLKEEYFLYEKAIAEVIVEKQNDYDCIVLAQASMSGAAKLVKEDRALILSSPEIGVKHLVSLLI